MKTEKTKRPMSKVKIATICVIVGLLAFGGTLAALLITRGNLGYKEALGYTDEILKTKDEVSAFLDTEFDDLELNDEEKKKTEEFSAATEKVAEYMESLGASSALKNKDVSEKYESAKKNFEKIQKVNEIQKEILGALDGEGGINEEELAKLTESDSEFLKKFAQDIIDYKKMAEEFAEKYADTSNIDEDAMIEDYGNFQIKGEEIADSYAEVSFKDIFGFSKDDALEFYASIEELVSILNEKI